MLLEINYNLSQLPFCDMEERFLFVYFFLSNKYVVYENVLHLVATEIEGSLTHTSRPTGYDLITHICSHTDSQPLWSVISQSQFCDLSDDFTAALHLIADFWPEVAVIHITCEWY